MADPKSDVRLTVHRSTHQIGGNCIELATSGGHRILLDVGRPLDTPQDERHLLPKSLNLAGAMDGVLISHPHQDHYGLLEDVPAEWPIYSGVATERIIRLTSTIVGKELRHTFRPWKSRSTLQIGPFNVTPFLIDHSAFDAYMLLIEVHGKRIFYSGDFRSHGRKAVLTKRLKAAPPKNIDVLLMEGTNLGSDKPCATEEELERDFVSLFRSTPGRVFVAWSAQNIDRTVTLYRACVKARRTLVVDLYTAEVMEALAGFGRLPRPGLPNLKVAFTNAFVRLYRRTDREAFLERMAPFGISADRLAATPQRWVAMARPSLICDYVKKGVAPNPDDAWCWSMWRGYLTNENGTRVSGWFEKGGSRACHIHTSGHASPDELQSFARSMNARQLVPIHGAAWDGYTTWLPSIKRLADGEPMTL